jgi:LPXTG-site transpeptidase (sortase) family protein
MEDIPFKNPSLKKQALKWLGLFLIIYALVFISFNFYQWSNRRESDFQVGGRDLGQPAKAVGGQERKCFFSDRPDSIFIPKIKSSAPLVSIGREETFKQALNRGVALYPGSVEPGQRGETVVLGHSAPSLWPKIRYFWVFNRVDELKPGDEIYVFYKNCRYLYKVKSTFFLDKGQDLPDIGKDSFSVLTLVSCWPPNTGAKRIAVRAELER